MIIKLKIPFDEIKDAIEEASYENHFFIDRKNHEIVFISEDEDDCEKKLEEVENDNFIYISPRMPNDDFEIMQSFIYKIKDFNLAQKFDKALHKRKPFRNFKELMNQHPELREEWFVYRDNEITKEVMNWLCKHNIELEDKSFMPKIDIKELKAEEVKIPKEFEGFGPIDCMNCGEEKEIKSRYFEVNVSNENMLVEKDIKRIMKKEYGIKEYGYMTGGEKDILIFSECLKCKSTNIFEDF